MERDLRRMTACGIGGVVLSLDPSVINDSFRSGRVKRFVELAGRPLYRGMKVALKLEGADGLPAALTHRDLASWVTGMRVQSLGALWQPTGRPAVIVRSDIELTGRPHPAVLALEAGPGGEWHTGGPGSASRFVPTPRFGQVLVYAGWQGTGPAPENGETGQWELPRRQGETLRRELWRAFDAKAPIICVSSWNDFHKGDFVEPNDLDGDSVYAVLREEIRRVKEACSSHVKITQPEE